MRDHRAHRRDLPSRPARRRPSAPLHGPQARHGPRPHAQLPPALRRVDAGSVPPLGRQDRAEHRRLDQRRARQPAASRTGVPHLPRHSARLFAASIRPALEAVSARAVELGVLNCKGVASLLARKLDRAGAPDSSPVTLIDHANLRGPRLLPLRGNPMLAHPTLDQLHALGLHGLAKGFKELEHNPEARGLDHAEWLGLLLEYELTLRRQKQFETRARVAKLRHPASVEDVNYQSPRGLDRALFLKLAACDWIAERRNLLITGASGLGKSWLACALGHKACRENLSVLYTRMPRLFADLAIAHGDAPLRQAPALARPRQTAHPRRLGPRGAHRRIKRAICSKSSRIATTRARSSSPARFPSTAGMT